MYEILRELFRNWVSVLSNFPKKTSFHGFKFIADSHRHWTERIFWLIIVSLSWYGSFQLIAAQYDAYKNNPISFVVDTDYKDWNTDFPSIAVCEIDNVKRVEETSDILWTPEHDFNLEEVLKEVAYFKGIAYYTSQFCGLDNPLPGCFSENLTYYANLVRSSCEDILANCSWNGQQFDCCKYFRPLQTEMGTCFTINSIQGEEENPPKYPMTSNRTTGPGSIRFSIMVQSNVYILNPEDVPSLTTMGSDLLTLGPEIFHRREITIRSIENDAEARSIPPSGRRCRYIDENILQVYRHYSYSACTVQCRMEAQIAACGCTNFFMPRVLEALKCNVSGLICLNDHISEFSVLKARWADRAGLFCDCLPSCTEAEISVVKDLKTATSEDFTVVEVALSVLPSERYRRNVVRGALDLVVSTGGTGGLFIGCSILSFVELVYFLCVKPICDQFAKITTMSDHWYEKYGKRKLSDNNFKPRKDWTFQQRKRISAKNFVRKIFPATRK